MTDASALAADDVGNILTSLGIERHRIVPTNVSQKILRQQSKFNQFESEIPYFPLEWFDCHDGGNELQFFVGKSSAEGIAFLPTTITAVTSHSSTSSTSTQINPNDFEWRQVSIVRYNETTNKWHVVELKSGTIYEVPRIYLMFNAENRMKFVERILRAVQLRDDSECHLRFEAILDGFSMEIIQQPSESTQNRIRKLLDRCKEESQEWIEFYQREYTIVYQKLHAEMYLRKFIGEQRKSNSMPGLQIQLPTRQERKLKNLEQMQEKHYKHQGIDDAMAHSYRKKSRRDIQKLWLYCCPQSIKIMEFIVDECKHVSQGGMSLFHLQTTPCTLEEFILANEARLLSMSNFLKAQWNEKIVNEIRAQLATLPRDEQKGWFNLNVESWEIFKMSKLHRLLDVIKVRMEVAVMMLLKSSLSAFVNHLCQPCECLLHVPAEYEWNEDDLLNSPFQPSPTSSTNSIFHIYLHIDDDKPTYSTSEKYLDTIEDDVVNMLSDRILTTHHIPQIDPYLITRLKFDEENLMLSSSIGVLNEDVQNHIRHLRMCMRKCLIPLHAYARQYRKFVELKQLNVEAFVDGDERFGDAKNIAAEIKNQLDLQENLKLKIPDTINIGPFLVDIIDLKSQLISKFNEIIIALKQKLLTNINEKLSSLQSRYDIIYNKLTEKHLNVEHLESIVEFIPSVQHQLQQFGIEMKILLTDFIIIDSFLIIQPDKLFALKWKALQMPQIITHHANETLAQREQEIERFRKIQVSDEIVFMERMQTISSEVEGNLKKYSFDDIKKAKSASDKIWKLLNETRERGELLNQRWRIFNQHKTLDEDGNEMPDNEIDMTQLQEEIERYRPHYSFWTMTSNFLASKDDWIQNQLRDLEIDKILTEMIELNKLIMLHAQDFLNTPRDVEFLQKEFQEMSKWLDIVKELRNPELNEIHWKKLNVTQNSTVSDLMMKGIPSVISDKVKQLLIDARLEATREREEKIRAEIEEAERKKQEEELQRQRQLRRAKRPDLFN